MSLAEGVAATIAYKVYASGTITANTLATSSSDLGASGAQYLRRVASTLNLQKATYQSAEVRSDRQIADFRHGVRRVQGNITGELSPATFFPLIEAVHRDTKTTALSLTEADLTSVAASASGSTFTFASGDLIALGVQVGMVGRFSGMSTTENNSVNFLVTGISGSNRVMTVSPAPTDQSTDTAFTLVFPGCTTIVPLTGHVSRKFGIEINSSDIDVSRLFTECRASHYRIQAPTTGMTTFEVGFMGRDMEMYEITSAPFFASPTAASTTGIVTSVNGQLIVGGVSQGVVTGFDMSMDLAPSPAEVLGQNFLAEIFLGRANVTGTVNAFLEDQTLINSFLNEDEIALHLMLTTTDDANSPFISLFLPRIKLGGSDINLQGEGGQTLTLPFQALLADGTVTGVKQSTILIHDSEAS